MWNNAPMDRFNELAQLFFETRQIIRDNVPEKTRDPNAWMRLEVVRFIGEKDHPGMKDIARYLRVQAPSATSLVAHLEREGLVARNTCREDKRITRIMLTSAGRRMLRAYEKRAAGIMRRVFGKLSASEVSELLMLLRRVQTMHAPRTTLPGR